MISRFKDFIKISFVHDASILGIGKFFSIFLSAISSIILARLSQPELYGIYGLIFAFVSLAGIFMNWGGDFTSLTLLSEAYAKKNKQEIKNILTCFVKVTLLTVCIIGVLGVVFAPLLTEFLYQNSQIGYWARIVLLASFLSIFLYSFLIKKDELLPSLRQIFLNFKKIEFKVYLEANASSKPVIGTYNCGAEDIIEDGYNGFLVPKNNIEKTSQAILKIFDNSDLAKKMGINGKKKA